MDRDARLAHSMLLKKRGRTVAAAPLQASPHLISDGRIVHLFLAGAWCAWLAGPGWRVVRLGGVSGQVGDHDRGDVVGTAGVDRELDQVYGGA